MTQQDKELLFKDLCARLPYGVKCEVHYIFNNETTYGEDVEAMKDDVIDKIDFVNGAVYTCELGIFSFLEDVKPYLRPMSSMTKEEFDEYEIANGIDTAESSKAIRKNLNGEKYISSWYHGVDWLNAHHFDYRGLIEKGLAIEAPKGMYN